MPQADFPRTALLPKVRLRPRERQAIEEAARYLEMSLSELTRAALTVYTERVLDRKRAEAGQ